MAFELDITTLGTQLAGADLSAQANQYKFVKMSGAGVILAAVSGEKVLGILANKPASGDVAEVTVEAVAFPVLAGAAFAAGAFLMTDATGRAITAATTGSTIVGQALEAASAAGDIVTMRLATIGVV